MVIARSTQEAVVVNLPGLYVLEPAAAPHGAERTGPSDCPS